MATQQDVPWGLSRKEYRKRLPQRDESLVDTLALADRDEATFPLADESAMGVVLLGDDDDAPTLPSPLPLTRPTAWPMSSGAPHIGGDDGGDDDDAMLALPEDGGAEPLRLMGSSSSESGEGGERLDARAIHRDAAVPHETVSVDGVLVRVIPHYRKGGRNTAARWVVPACPAHGPACTKSRSVEKDNALFGANGVRIFIGAWLAVAESMDPVAHKRWAPGNVEMEIYGREKELID